jgi:hypothetical protein
MLGPRGLGLRPRLAVAEVWRAGSSSSNSLETRSLLERLSRGGGGGDLLRMVAAAEGLLRMVAWGLEHQGMPRRRYLPHTAGAGIEDPEPVTDGGEP